MPRKPTPKTIRNTTPLTRLRLGLDPLSACNACGVAVDSADLPLQAWREHDEHDKPIAGNDALVFIGQGPAHERCQKLIVDHPRLYAEEDDGNPGAISRLCAPCVHREGLRCTHRDLKANGGPGLKISLTRLAGIICSRGRHGSGCHSPPRTAVDCAGREVKS